MVSVCDLLNVFVTQFFSAAVDEMTEVARINEQDFILCGCPLLRARFINHNAAGICVFKNNLAGRFTMQSIRLPSAIIDLRMSPSPLVLLVSAPLASTTPALPCGLR